MIFLISMFEKGSNTRRPSRSSKAISVLTAMNVSKLAKIGTGCLGSKDSVRKLGSFNSLLIVEPVLMLVASLHVILMRLGNEIALQEIQTETSHCKTLTAFQIFAEIWCCMMRAVEHSGLLVSHTQI